MVASYRGVAILECLVALDDDVMTIRALELDAPRPPGIVFVRGVDLREWRAALRALQLG
jgi:hypothetical protein